ncbi:hypothetical protein B5P40_32080, partial [Bacillus sp. SRB_8]
LDSHQLARSVVVPGGGPDGRGNGGYLESLLLGRSRARRQVVKRVGGGVGVLVSETAGDGLRLSIDGASSPGCRQQAVPSRGGDPKDGW